ncbi:MAG: SH3 domain-containing protein [Thiobacillaceae bacterium]
MTLLRYARHAVLSAFLFMACPAWSASGTMLRDDQLRAAASASAAVMAQVPRGASVEVLARQGGWTQIRVSGRTGWVRMLSVRTTDSSRRDVGGELAGVVGMGTRQADPSRVVSVAGVRGLSPQDLQAARFDAQELERLDRYAVSRAEAQAFAREGGLAARRVDYLPAPAQGERQSSPWEEPQW